MNKEEMLKNTVDTISSVLIKNDRVVNNFIKLINDQPNDFWGKKSNVGHITASVLVFNEDLDEVLLTHHKKFNKWLQLGGHWCDFEEFPSKTLLDSGKKEVEEEGYNDKPIEQFILLNGSPLDLDVHGVGDHSHYDVCFASIIKKSIPIFISSESHDVSWIKTKDLFGYTNDSRLKRMIQFINDNRFELLNEYNNSKVKLKL